MDDLKKFELRYKELPDSKLLELWKERNTLRSELVPVLKNEILTRGIKIDDSVVEVQSDYSDLSYKELQEFVSERLQTGESIESIKIDLADHGINVMELFNRESEKNEKVYNFLASSQKHDEDEEYVKQTLKEEYGIEEGEIPEYKQQMKSRAKAYISVGGVLIFLSAIFLLIASETGMGGIRGILALLGGGVFLLMKGLSQRKA
jgi:hypothetical protein